jgi:hypothetical protein
MIAIAVMVCVIANAAENNSSSPAGSKLTEIRAGDIAPDDSGSIVCNNVKIIGDLYLNQTRYNSLMIKNSIVEGNVYSEGPIFDGFVDLTNTTFDKNVTFFRVKLNDETDLSRSRFLGNANFNESTFLDGATFDYCTFDKNVSARASSFPKFISFYKSTIKGDADLGYSQSGGVYANFDRVKMLNGADFTSSHFDTYLSFSSACILKKLDFHAATFAMGVNFGHTKVGGVADFRRCEFGKEALFSGMSFNNTTNFINSRFDGPSLFTGTRFYRDALFDSAQFVGPSDFSDTLFDQNLSMNSISTNTMMLDGASFNKSSHLSLAKADINRFMANWSLIKDILSFDSSAYLSLVKNYRDMGLDEADDCYYQYRYLSQESKGWEWSKLYDWLAWVTCGYGVKPVRPVICSAFLILFCALIFFFGRGLKGHENTNKKELFFDSLFYSLATFLEVHSEIKPSGKYRYVGIVLKSFSWILFALLIGALTKVMIG